MEYRVLGPIEVVQDGPPLSVQGKKPRALLALLLMRRNEPVPTELLIEDLWGDQAPATAANTLQVYVSQLRKIVNDRVSREGSAYRLRVDPDELDAERFERLAEEGDAALRGRSFREAADLLAEGLSLWRGPALADLRYESFAQGAIARLEELRLVANENRIEADLGLGRHDQVIGELEALIAEHPARERLRSLHMLALYRAGRQADALDAYQAARQTLLDDLGLEPGPELRELEQAILRQDETLSRRPLPQSNVPVPASTLVGRRRELDQVTSALRGPTRVLTLTGPGGSGKTRLAIEAANVLADELADGAFFVALDAIRDPALLLPAIAEAVAVKESGDRSLRESLAERLAGRQALLVIDNFEQLVEAAPVLSEVLEAAPGLSFLVTSRSALRVSGEQEYPLDPLDLEDAVALFVERARRADPRFALTDENAAAVEEICGRLDGLPLAVELAAARTKLLPPDAMLALLDERLDLLSRGARDLPERHRALRDTVAWSYDLLGPDEKTLFAQLSVFGGGFTLESAVAVCDASLDGVATLLDDSLLERDGPRFKMLETIREYALEQLAAEQEPDDVRRRHAEHFLKLAESDPVPEQAAWLARMDAERDNFREALSWSLDTREASLGLRLAAALWEFWWVRGYLAEGRGWLGEALLRGRSAAPELRARALHASGSLATRQGDYESAGALFEESLAICGGAGRRCRDGALAALDRHGRSGAGRPGARDRALGACGRALRRVRGPAGSRARDQQPRRDRPRARRVREGGVAERAGLRALRDPRGQRGHGLRARQPGVRGALADAARPGDRAPPGGTSQARRARVQGRDRLLLRRARRRARVHGASGGGGAAAGRRGGAAREPWRRACAGGADDPRRDGRGGARRADRGPVRRDLARGPRDAARRRDRLRARRRDRAHPALVSG